MFSHDPLVNICSPESQVYIKRELFSWVDLIKLRFGDGPQDCPELWKYMEDYTRKIASIFHGVRLDNCHNTPLNVAQHLLDVARSVREDLYVMAELFTNSVTTDHMYASNLAITSLIRESKNSSNANEFADLCYQFSGVGVGSLEQIEQFFLKESEPKAIFYDLTHDNPCFIPIYTVYDALSRSALVEMCNCAYGMKKNQIEIYLFCFNQ